MEQHGSTIAKMAALIDEKCDDTVFGTSSLREKSKTLKQYETEKHVEHSSESCVEYDTGKNPKQHWCFVCAQRFSNENFLSHMESHTQEEQSHHHRKQAGNTLFQCQVCDMRYLSGNEFNRHLTLHNIKSPEILIPDWKSTIVQKQNVRGKNETDGKKYNCSICVTSFDNLAEFRTHMISHMSEPPRKLSELRDVEADYHKCSVCSKIFVSDVYLDIHMRTHDGEKQYKCSVCEEIFLDENKLTTHMVRHTGRYPHDCPVCGKDFPYKGHLDVHMRVHTGEKPFQCSVCGEGFAVNCNLQQHMRKHTGERPFTCSTCGKSFGTKNVLRCHLKTHSGERPHVCLICGKAFAKKYNLKVHTRIHTGEKQEGGSDIDQTD